MVRARRKFTTIKQYGPDIVTVLSPSSPSALLSFFFPALFYHKVHPFKEFKCIHKLVEPLAFSLFEIFLIFKFY